MSYFGPDPKRAYIENLNDILDVQSDLVVDREILAYDGNQTVWTTRKLELADLTDVSYTSPANNSLLVYNNTIGKFEVQAFTTDDVSEGTTNLYYTDARVGAYLSSNNFATTADVTAAVSNLVDQAPATLDTLNEIATALNDDPNFSTTITTLIGTKLNTADFQNSFDVSFSQKTSDNLTEGSVNRYFTNTRFNTAFDTRLATAIQNTDSVTEGSNNLYFSNERVDDRVASLLIAGTNITITYNDASGTLTIDSVDTEDNLSNNTTDELAEGQNNLYYTDARADARASSVASNQILNTVTKSFVDSLGVNANYLDNLDSTQFIRKDQDVTLTKQITFPSTTSVRPVLPSGFLSRSDTLIGSAVIWSPSEQYHPTNTTVADQYGIMFNYTAANPSLNTPTETKLRFIGGGSDKFVIDLDGKVTYDTYEVATLNDIGSNLNLSNKSTTDLAEGTNLYYTDERVDDRVASLFNAGTNLSATYDDANNTYSINVDNTGGFNLANNTTTDLAEGTNKYYTDSRADARVTAGFSSKSTDQLSEGSNNLYFTDERAQDAVASLFANGTHTNITVTYDDVNNNISLSSIDTEDNLSNNTTNDLAEGNTNLYFTNARADARADARIALQVGANLDLSQRTSDNLPEGTIHRYYRTSRFNTDFSSKSTDDLTEGGANLYFTDARVGTYLSSNGYDTASNIVASITDSAPATLDTLNELAAALGDDPNFATTVTNSIATKLPLAGGTMTGSLTTSGNVEAVGGKFDSLIVNTGSNPFTVGGVPKVAVVAPDGDVGITIGSSNNNLMYIRNQEVAGEFVLQTYNGGNTGELHLQPYGGVVSIGTASPSGSYPLEVAGKGHFSNNITTNAAIGIGTTNPTATYTPTLHVYGSNPNLHLQGSGTGSWAYFELENVNYNRAFGMATNGAFRITDNKTNMDTGIQLEVLQNGNLGVGVSNPSRQLHIFDSSRSGSYRLLVEGDTGHTGIEIKNQAASNTNILFRNPSTTQEIYMNSAGSLYVGYDSVGEPGIEIEPHSNDYHKSVRIHNSHYLRQNNNYKKVIYKSSGATAATHRIGRMRKHYWGSGVLKLEIHRTYYTGYQHGVFICDGHTRHTHSPYVSVRTISNNNTCPTPYWGSIVNTGNTEGYADLYIDVPAYYGYVIVCEVNGASVVEDDDMYTGVGANIWYING